MPKIVISEIDETTAGTGTDNYDIVYVVGFATSNPDYINFTTAALPFTPKLCTTIDEFEAYFGTQPAYFTTTQWYSDITDLGFSFADNAIPATGIMRYAGDPDLSYIYAKECINAGLGVIYERVNPISTAEPISIKQIYKAMGTYSTYDPNVYNVDGGEAYNVFANLKDKGEFTVKYMTSGGYPTFEVGGTINKCAGTFTPVANTDSLDVPTANVDTVTFNKAVNQTDGTYKFTNVGGTDWNITFPNGNILTNVTTETLTNMYGVEFANKYFATNIYKQSSAISTVSFDNDETGKEIFNKKFGTALIGTNTNIVFTAKMNKSVLNWVTADNSTFTVDTLKTQCGITYTVTAEATVAEGDTIVVSRGIISPVNGDVVTYNFHHFTANIAPTAKFTAVLNIPYALQKFFKDNADKIENKQVVFTYETASKSWKWTPKGGQATVVNMSDLGIVIAGTVADTNTLTVTDTTVADTTTYRHTLPIFGVDANIFANTVSATTGAPIESGTTFNIVATYSGGDLYWVVLADASQDKLSGVIDPVVYGITITGTNILDGDKYSITYTKPMGGNVIVDIMTDVCYQRQDCTALIDHTDRADRALSATNMGSVYASATNIDSNYRITANAEFAAMFTPWYQMTCPATATTNAMPASYVYLVSLGRSIKNNPNWLAIAGASRGVVQNAIAPNTTKTLTEAIANTYEPRNGIAINPICNIKPYGYLIWGNRTLKNNAIEGNLTATSFLNTRNMVSDIKKLAYTVAKRLMFEQNNEILWTNFKFGITPLLDQMLSGAGIQSYKIMRDTTSAKAREKATVVAKIIIVPIYAVEDFYITVVMRDGEVEVTLG